MKLLAKISIELRSDSNRNSIWRIYKNKEYKVFQKYLSTNTPYYSAYDDNYEYCLFRPDQIKDYFYTIQETRKLKLNTISQSGSMKESYDLNSINN